MTDPEALDLYESRIGPLEPCDRANPRFSAYLAYVVRKALEAETTADAAVTLKDAGWNDPAECAALLRETELPPEPERPTCPHCGGEL